MVADYYYYSLLNKDEQILYKVIYECVQKHETEAVAHGVSAQTVDTRKVIEALIEDNPHLYYLDTRQMLFRQEDESIMVIPQYCFDEDTCLLYTQKINKNVNDILALADIAHKKNEYEKVKAIYDILVVNGKYDTNDNPLVNKRDYIMNHTILGLLLERNGVCEGISKAFKLVLNAANIKCITVSGTARRTANVNDEILNHAWNIAKIDGKSYHMDLTWAIENSDKKSINYDYFGLTDDQIKKDHWGFTDTPDCLFDDANYYNRNGLVAYSNAELDRIIKKYIKGSGFSISLRVDFECNFSKICKNINKMIMDTMQRSSNGRQAVVSIGARETQKIIHIDVDVIL